MSRKVREIKKNFKVFCEGDTEFHYVNEMKRQKRIPHILIVNCPDFEYVGCLHTPKYKGQDVARYIIKEMGYRDIDAFKSDKKIYSALNKNGNSSDVMLAALKRENCFVVNECKVNLPKFKINIKTSYNWEKLGRRGSNINEFFEIIDSF